ncbi:dynein regulatory complex protein 1 [Octopus sinensis]|uniref:Dynein regulatory complex protein 1 n=1 Tax=Octopus sinensis TaxID=2607531 RepID=A0A6P7S999_9MOLL|nr:dynein regulatory complex protein 1 [Octopus sinensis]
MDSTPGGSGLYGMDKHSSEMPPVIEPDVNSDDPEERILARRLRIERTIERTKKGDEVEPPPTDVKEEMSKGVQQIEMSRQRLKKLECDGSQLVTNIRTAGDSRESQRRIQYEESSRLRKERMEHEAKTSAERFEEINKKWEITMQKDVPHSLFEALEEQKKACDVLLDEKNKLINDFQLELKKVDDNYVKDLKKQADDIDLMVERMEEQIKVQRKAFRDELDEIERVYLREREEIMKLHRQRWDKKMKKRRGKELEYLEISQKRIGEYEELIHQVRIQDAEEYQKVKLKLETEVQNLEQLLQRLRATCQLNQEKLEYNFQVLKKRDEENTIIKSKQKRKITRLQDVLNNIKSKLAKQEKHFKEENQQLTDDYKRLTEQFQDLEKRAKHFMAIDLKKFHDLWCLNEDICKDLLLNGVLSAQRVIFTQQLGLEWKMPNVSFTENKGPIKYGQIDVSFSATQILSHVLLSKGNVDEKRKSMKEKPVLQSISSAVEVASTDENKRMSKEERLVKIDAAKAKIFKQISPVTVKSILELICDESDFLIELKLNTLLENLEKDERMLMKLDSVFCVLGVTTESDILHLATFFRLSSDDFEGKEDELNDMESKVVDDASSKCEKSFLEAEMSTQASEERPSEFDEFTESQITITTKRLNYNEPQLIHPNDVLKALRSFVEKHHSFENRSKSKLTSFQLSKVEQRKDSCDSIYWKKYYYALSKDQERLWDALIHGLEKYHQILQDRANLIDENSTLSQQNQELNILLHQYINAKVNDELQIPPTRVLQLNLNNSDVEPEQFVFH